MDYTKLEGNSRKQENQPATRESVVSGGVKTGKPSIGTRLQSEMNTQWKDVLIPAAKDMAVDMARNVLDGIIEMGKNAIDMKIYGEVKTRRGTRGVNSYSSYWSKSDKKPASSSKSDERNSPVYEDLIFDRHADAKAVLDGLSDILDEYQVVTVADMLELAGENPHYTDRDYGWFKLGRAEILGTRDGYILRMPRPMVVR